MLQVGDKAPAIVLSDQDGTVVKLTGFKGRKVLIYFYPKADTPGCTQQACGLNEVLDQVQDTVVVGVSPDAPAKLRKFASKYSLQFALLSDEDHAVSESYGVWKEKSLYGKRYMGVERSAFLLDEKGRLTHVWYKVSPKDTPKYLLAALNPSP